jgi:hypothetical protein
MHRRRAILGASLRSSGTVTLLLVAYYEAPLDRPLNLSTGLLFVAALLLFAVVVVAQIRAILRSGRPRLLAIRALVLGVPLLLVLFAATYCTVGAQQPGAFSEPLSRTDGLYFTTTTLATVGFGDITPRSELARILVTVQMLVGLLTVGVIAKVVLGAVQEAEGRRVEASAASPGESPSRGNRVDDGDGGAGAPAPPGRARGPLQAASEGDGPARGRVDVDQQRLDQESQRDRQQGSQRAQQPRPEDQGEEGDRRGKADGAAHEPRLDH